MRLSPSIKRMLAHIRNGINAFAYDVRAAPTAASIVSIAVGVLLVGILVPIGISQIMAANTTGWDAAVKTVFTVVLPILAVIGVAIKYIPSSRK